MQKRTAYCENPICSLAVFSVMGDRTDQQDDFGYMLDDERSLIIVCDGMGGHEGGRLASNAAVNRFILQYKSAPKNYEIIPFLEECTALANADVLNLKTASGEKLNAGSTLVAVMLDSSRNLYWNSVGDSRLYLFRDGDFAQITQDHNYTTVLLEKLNAGMIDREEFNSENLKGEALISFLGISGSPLVDYNNLPLPLLPGDRLVIMSDGLYKVLPDADILNIVNNFSNVNETAMALEIKAEKTATKNGISRDNTTIAVLKIK